MPVFLNYLPDSKHGVKEIIFLSGPMCFND